MIERSLVCVVLTVFLALCSFLPGDPGDTKGEPIERDWYDEVVEGIGVMPLADAMKEGELAESYRVLYNYAKNSYRYYALEIDARGQAGFRYIYHDSERLSAENILIDEMWTLSDGERDELLAVFSESVFWAYEPEDEIGLDGVSIFMEGCKGRRVRFFYEWDPEGDSRCSTIGKAFIALAERKYDGPEIANALIP